jgi:hypothetical protein
MAPGVAGRWALGAGEVERRGRRVDDGVRCFEAQQGSRVGGGPLEFRGLGRACEKPSDVWA